MRHLLPLDRELTCTPMQKAMLMLVRQFYTFCGFHPRNAEMNIE